LGQANTLDNYVTGNFSFGCFGGVMDAAAGLWYVGNGQYYDPPAGRFLSRGDANPNDTNPYVPWDPTGTIIGPLGVAALFFGRKRKKGSKWGTLCILFLVIGSVSMTLSACKVTVAVSPPTETPSPTQTITVASDTEYTATFTVPTPPDTPMPTTTYTCPFTPLPGQAGIAYITIDDGPGGYTGAVLDVLAKYQVKATFFLLGKNIEQYPGEVQRMKAEGHAIGIHSWDHPDWRGLPAQDQANQIQLTQQALLHVTGAQSNLLRAPGGAPTYADISGLDNYNWSHDSFDYYLKDPQVVADNVFKGVSTNAVPISDNDRVYTQNISIDMARPSQPIVLIHSIHPVDPSALELLILGFRDRGYSFGVLPRPCDGPVHQPQFHGSLNTSSN
jgi:peptidoglycan/xylan/chitin deacetylase (PgdA/CDA1 family)